MEGKTGQPCWDLSDDYTFDCAEFASCGVDCASEPQGAGGGGASATVSSSLTFASADLANLADGSVERATFEADFKSAMAAELAGVDETDITVDEIVAGSVVVRFSITVDPAAASAISDDLTNNMPATLTVGSYDADTSTMETPAITGGPSPPACTFLAAMEALDGPEAAVRAMVTACAAQMDGATIDVKSTCDGGEVCAFSALIDCVDLGSLAMCNAVACNNVANAMRAMDCGDGASSGTGGGR